MTIFKPYGHGRIIQDKKAIQNNTKILDRIQGFDISHENGAYILDMTTVRVCKNGTWSQ